MIKYYETLCETNEMRNYGTGTISGIPQKAGCQNKENINYSADCLIDRSEHPMYYFIHSNECTGRRTGTDIRKT